MDGKKALYYAAIAIAVLIGVSVVVSVVSALLGLVSAIISGVITLAVLAGLGYAAYKAGSWLLGSDDEPASLDSIGSGSSSVDAGSSRQDRLRQQYVEGQISEAEFERRIGEELETEELDDIDRELERER
jgi:divalent metal cation (Fe/Co/Zn/Cd) transporter